MLLSLKGKVAIAALLLLLLDFASKELTVRHLPLIGEVSWTYPYGGIAVFEDFFGIEFSLSFTTNKGAAWGMFRDYPMLLNLFRVCLISGLAWFYWTGVSRRSCVYGLGLVLAGATGNVIDFCRFGYVVDMLNFKFWGYDYPVFNLADCYIFIGVALLILFSFTHSHEKEPA